jgi:hypothetical protein
VTASLDTEVGDRHDQPPGSARRWLLTLVVLLAVAVLAVSASALTSKDSSRTSGPRPESTLWPDGAAPTSSPARDTRRVTLGVNFSARFTGTVTALRFYKSDAGRGPYTGQLWTAGGQLLRAVRFPSGSAAGWQVARLPVPVIVHPGTTYVASYTAPHGGYVADHGSLSPSAPRVTSDLTAWRGVYTYAAGVPTETRNDSNYYVDVMFAPTTTPDPGTPPRTATSAAGSPNAGFPNADDTGPSGSLTSYSGPCTITSAGAVIDSKTVTCDLVIKARGVVVRNSSIRGRIVSNTSGADVTVVDSLVDGGQQETFPSVSYQNITLSRVEVTGGQHSVQCSYNCTVLDSWLHNQYLPRSSAGHVNAFISNGGSRFVLRHNTLHCTPEPTASGGCTADASLFGDFGPISDATIDNNLFKARSTGASYCLDAGYNPAKPYGSNPTGVVVTDNVFERGTNNRYRQREQVEHRTRSIAHQQTLVRAPGLDQAR